MFCAHALTLLWPCGAQSELGCDGEITTVQQSVAPKEIEVIEGEVKPAKVHLPHPRTL